MSAQIINFKAMRERQDAGSSNPIIAALDALGLALAYHNHQWTDRERLLYETALNYVGLATT